MEEALKAQKHLSLCINEVLDALEIWHAWRTEQINEHMYNMCINHKHESWILNWGFQEWSIMIAAILSKYSH